MGNSKITKTIKKEIGGLVRIAGDTAGELSLLTDPSLVADPKALLVKASASVGTKILGRIFGEYQKKLELGELKDAETTYPEQAMLEILEAVENAPSDQDRIEAMKNIFMRSISKDATKEEEVLAYQLIQTCKKLSGEDILILKTTYEIALSPKEKSPTNSVAHWSQLIAAKMGHNLSELIKRREKHLADNGLIAPRDTDDYQTSRPHSTFTPTHNMRLTPLGMKFCEFMSKDLNSKDS